MKPHFRKEHQEVKTEQIEIVNREEVEDEVDVDGEVEEVDVDGLPLGFVSALEVGFHEAEARSTAARLLSWSHNRWTWFAHTPSIYSAVLHYMQTNVFIDDVQQRAPFEPRIYAIDGEPAFGFGRYSGCVRITVKTIIDEANEETEQVSLLLNDIHLWPHVKQLQDCVIHQVQRMLSSMRKEMQVIQEVTLASTMSFASTGSGGEYSFRQQADKFYDSGFTSTCSNDIRTYTLKRA